MPAFVFRAADPAWPAATVRSAATIVEQNRENKPKRAGAGESWHQSKSGAGNKQCPADKRGLVTVEDARDAKEVNRRMKFAKSDSELPPT